MFRRNPSGQLNPIDPPSDEHIDGLTGLPDRWQFESWVGEGQVRSRRSGDRFGLFLVGVSNLAEINTGYGSDVGDEVLQAVANALVAVVGRRGQVARYLGGEFGVVWPSMFSGDEVSAVASELLTSLPQQVEFNRFVVPVSVSVAGVLSEAALDERRLLADVEQTMAEARLMDGDRVAVRSDIFSTRRTIDVLALRLQRAFDGDEFQLYYQPIVSLRSGKVVGFEGVLRWLAPDAGPMGAELITPGTFLDALRTSPIVVPLHLWVLNETASNTRAWSAQIDNPTLFGGTNLDPAFVTHDRFAEVVQTALEQNQLRPTQMLFDINGEAVGSHANGIWPPLQRVKQSGVGLALEEFGVGYSSPNLLRRCRFDIIRLPRSFVGGLGLAEEDRIIVRGLVDLAHQLGCRVIAEGVETAQQVAILQELGCDFGQGWLFGKPLPAAEVTNSMDSIVRSAKTKIVGVPSPRVPAARVGVAGKRR